MKTKKIKALFIEDSIDDLQLILRELNKSSYNIIYNLVEDSKGLEAALQEDWDIIISDYALHGFNGFEALKMCNKKGIDIPFIIVSNSEQIAVDMVEIMRSGARDYIMKNNPDRLLPAIEREIAGAKIRRERKRAELKSQNSEKIYRELVENMGEGVTITDEKEKFIFVNPAAEKIFGVGKGELNGLGLENFISGEKLKMIKNHTKERSQGKSGVYEHEIILKDGSKKDILITATPRFEDKIFKGTFGVFRDIAKQKQAEAALIASETKYRNLVENALIGIYTTNTQGKHLFANAAMCEILEYDSIDEFINTDVETLYKDKKERAKFIKTINKSKQISNYEIELITKKGKTINVIINAFISGEIITGMMMDISARKRAEQEIINAKEKAEEMSRLKTNFLANMSHEIRTPLNGILGFSEIIKDENDFEEVKNMAGIINESGKRLLNTLDQILDLSSLEANTKELNYKLTDIKRIIKETIVLFGAAARKKNLKLEFESDINPLTAYTEPDLISNILNNLVSNAIIYTQQGSVCVRAKEETINEKECIIINVIDTGIGIKKGNLEIIFDEFRQVSEGWGRRFEGIGLGLSLCEKYMNLLGGSISVTSKHNEGSDFRLVIPTNNIQSDKSKKSKEDNSDENSQQDNSAVTSQQDKSAEIFHQDKGEDKSDIRQKILYIEDDKNCILLVKMILGNQYDIDAATNGADGIEKTKNNEYALILLDINLGKGITGLEALSEIRKNPYYKNIPVIAITAFAMVGDEEEFRAGGCTDYISKPFNKQILPELIAKALKK